MQPQRTRRTQRKRRGDWRITFYLFGGSRGFASTKYFKFSPPPLRFLCVLRGCIKRKSAFRASPLLQNDSRNDETRSDGRKESGRERRGTPQTSSFLPFVLRPSPIADCRPNPPGILHGLHPKEVLLIVWLRPDNQLANRCLLQLLPDADIHSSGSRGEYFNRVFAGR